MPRKKRERERGGAGSKGRLVEGPSATALALTRHAPPFLLPPLFSKRRQVKLNPSKYFVLHIDVVTQDKNALRISLSNLFKLEGPRVKGSIIQARGKRGSS